MMERKTYYVDLEVGDFIYADEEEGSVIQRYFFGLLKRYVPKQAKYRVTEIYGVDTFGVARKEFRSRATFLKIGLVNLETKKVSHIYPTSYTKLAKKRK